MKGPLHYLGNKFGWDQNRLLEECDDENELRDLKRVSKIGAIAFAGVTAISAGLFVHHVAGTEVSLETGLPDYADTAGATVINIAFNSPLLAIAGMSGMGTLEWAELYRRTSKKLEG